LSPGNRNGGLSVPDGIITVVVIGDSEEEELSWAEWKARSLNQLFAEMGTGGPGHITAETVARSKGRGSKLLKV
jgi:hypothetical protein